MIGQKLQELTDGLLYISESEGEFDIHNVADKEASLELMREIAGQSVMAMQAENATIFFEQTINALDPGDEVMMELKEKYRLLFQYLQESFSKLEVFIAGQIGKHIFILCSGAESYLLHTTAVES